MPRTLALLLSCACLLAACGGGSSTSSSTPAGPSPGVSDAVAQQVTDADVAIFSAANATRSLVGNPQGVAHAIQLLKPLTVSNVLHVNESDPSVGGLVSSLYADLDNTAPGLTTQTANGERLNQPLVNRLLRYGKIDPTQVFYPKAAGGVSQLERLLKGMRRDSRVTPQGFTAGSIVSRDVQTASAYWPDLSKRLQTLDSSLG